MPVSFMRVLCTIIVTATLAGAAGQAAWAQSLEPVAPSAAPNPLSDPTVNNGKILLFDLEARFAKDVLERGGVAFAEWFAEDGVALGNGETPKIGRVAIAKSAT